MSEMSLTYLEKVYGTE